MSKLIRKSKQHYDRSAIFLEAVNRNNLNFDDIAYLCEEDESLVKQWFNLEQKPTQFALMQLHSALYIAKMVIPRLLTKFVESQQSRAKYWGKKFQTNNDKAIIDRDNKQIERYEFHGELLRLSEIEQDKRCVVTKNTLRSRIKVAGLKAGDDVSQIAAIYRQQGIKIKERA